MREIQFRSSFKTNRLEYMLHGSTKFLIFLKQPSRPKTMYAEHWRKLAWTTFLILLVQQFCGPLMNSSSLIN